MAVIGVDEVNGYIDLSKKMVQPDDIEIRKFFFVYVTKCPKNKMSDVMENCKFI